jgi:3',5'-nucleoside bisphosphate phosphatase
MRTVKADLHIHTVLSPCGDLEMSPRTIVAKAIAQNLEIIGITDYNTTRQIPVIADLAQKKGIFVLRGVEITTKEEIHCLAFFPDEDACIHFQQYLDDNLPFIDNREGAFGYQVLVDVDEKILEMEHKLLVTALTKGIDDIERTVHGLGGIFIPAHIDKKVNSILSQLGFIPPGLHFEALEITCFTTANESRRKFKINENVCMIQNSDAHFPDDIGKGFSLFVLEALTFEEVRLAMLKKDGRGVILAK